MTDDEAQEVQKAVEDYLNGLHGRGFDIGNPRHFEQLVASVCQRINPATEDDLRVVTAMCVLNPGVPTIPPAVMRDELLAIVQRYVPKEANRPARLMEFAIAYGCGKWRAVQGGSGGWKQPWEGAQRALVRALEPAVEEANRWLEKHVVGFPQGRNIPQDPQFPEGTAVWSDASFLAMRLIHPEKLLCHIGEGERLSITCADDGTELAQEFLLQGVKRVWTVGGGSGAIQRPTRSGGSRARRDAAEQTMIFPQGAKIVISAGDDEAHVNITVGETETDWKLSIGETAWVMTSQGIELAVWECTCGTTRCQERHRLEAWEPAQVSLWSFVASAVKGPRRHIQSGSFVQGMYFALLTEEDL